MMPQDKQYFKIFGRKFTSVHPFSRSVISQASPLRMACTKSTSHYYFAVRFGLPYVVMLLLLRGNVISNLECGKGDGQFNLFLYLYFFVLLA